MSHLLSLFQSTGAVVLTLGLVIFLHEFGHFILCRRLGVRVERLSFGFGPELLGVTKGPTRYSICAIPLGGYVKPAGEDVESATGAPDEYFSQSWKRRLLIVAAGPAMNYVLAFGIFSGSAYIQGLPKPSTEPVIGNLAEGYPAQTAGLELGDRIVAVDGAAVATWSEMSAAVHARADKSVSLTFKRNGRSRTISIRPRKDPATGRGLIGILPQTLYDRPGLLGSVVDGAQECWRLTEMTVETIASKIAHRQRPDLAGPVGIVQMVSRAAKSGFGDLVYLIGVLSVAIGFFNILPVPILDGGHAAFYLWEGVSGHKPTRDLVAKANSVGLALLFSLLLFATYNDIRRLAARPSPAAAPSVAPKTP